MQHRLNDVEEYIRDLFEENPGRKLGKMEQFFFKDEMGLDLHE